MLNIIFRASAFEKKSKLLNLTVIRVEISGNFEKKYTIKVAFWKLESDRDQFTLPERNFHCIKIPILIKNLRFLL